MPLKHAGEVCPVQRLLISPSLNDSRPPSTWPPRWRHGDVLHSSSAAASTGSPACAFSSSHRSGGRVRLPCVGCGRSPRPCPRCLSGDYVPTSSGPVFPQPGLAVDLRPRHRSHLLGQLGDAMRDSRYRRRTPPQAPSRPQFRRRSRPCAVRPGDRPWRTICARTSSCMRRPARCWATAQGIRSTRIR